MRTKNAHAVPAHAAAVADRAPLDLLTEYAQQQLAVANECASAMFRGSEAIRKLQQGTAQRASEQHSVAADRLRQARDISDIQEIQAELLRFDLQQAGQYWQELASAMYQAQTDLVRAAGQALTEGPDEQLKAAMQGMQAWLDLVPAANAMLIATGIEPAGVTAP